MTEHETTAQGASQGALVGPDGGVAATEQVGAVAAPVGSGRPDGVVAWVGWHLVELAAVGVPVVLAVTAHPLWTVPAVVAAAGWRVHEVRTARRAAALRATASGARAVSAVPGESVVSVSAPEEVDSRGLA